MMTTFSIIEFSRSLIRHQLSILFLHFIKAGAPHQATPAFFLIVYKLLNGFDNALNQVFAKYRFPFLIHRLGRIAKRFDIWSVYTHASHF